MSVRFFAPKGGAMSVHSRARSSRCCLAGLLLAPALSVAAPFAYVTSWPTPSAVSVIDTANNSIVATVASSGGGPIAANAAGTRVYVASYDGVSIIDTTANAVIGKVLLDGEIGGYGFPSGVAVNLLGTRAYVSLVEGGWGGYQGVAVMDLTTNTILAALPFEPFDPVAVVVNPAGTRVYVPVSARGFAADEVWVLDAATYAVSARIMLLGGVGKLAMNAAGTRLYVAGVPWNGSGYSLSIIDTATNTIVATALIAGLPTDVAVSADGTRIYVATYPDRLFVLDAATLVDVATVPVGAFPHAVATNPDATRIYVASVNSNDVSVLDTATNTVVATVPVIAPTDIVVTGATAGSEALVEAVEYYYADWNYYFETAFPAEIAALDGGAFGGAWRRTGETFNVWPQPNASASPTCRFFSIAFAPKSSHFYTAFPGECAAVKANPGWQFESIAFYVQIPIGYGTGDGFCPQGTRALYRAYNNGLGGAPNHRYTTNLATLDAMLAQGWTFEGEANTKVFACVPQ